MPLKDKKKRSEYDRTWAKRNPIKVLQIQNRYVQKLRLAALALLGNKCVRCGFLDNRALQFDHIKGGGGKHKKTVSRNFYSYIIESVLKNRGEFQILCANCNWIKRVENNELKPKRKICL